MTNEINQNWKAVASISIAAVLIVAILSFNPMNSNVAEAAATPKTVIVGDFLIPVQTGCIPGADNVKHWDKIIFEVPRLLSQLGAPDANPAFLKVGQAYDIKVPDTVGVIADLHQIVVDDLISKDYFDVAAGDKSPTPSNIIIVDVEYAIFCITP